MELFVTEIIFDDPDLDLATYEVGVFDSKDKAHEEGERFLDALIKESDAEDNRNAYEVYVWSAVLNQGRENVR